MDWEYYITKSELWFKIFREKEEDGVKRKEWLQTDTYTLNRNFARTFYHLNSATSALVIARIKWRNETKDDSKETFESIHQKCGEKQSRSEF